MSVKIGDDKGMMEQIGEWPLWPVLPVKKPREDEPSWYLNGFMVDPMFTSIRRLPVFTVFEGPVHSLGGEKKLDDFLCHKYESVEDALEAGWIVD